MPLDSLASFQLANGRSVARAIQIVALPDVSGLRIGRVGRDDDAALVEVAGPARCPPLFDRLDRELLVQRIGVVGANDLVRESVVRLNP